jgi:hypothetical protein
LLARLGYVGEQEPRRFVTRLSGQYLPQERAGLAPVAALGGQKRPFERIKRVMGVQRCHRSSYSLAKLSRSEQVLPKNLVSEARCKKCPAIRV